MVFQERLREKRTEAGISQVALAEAAGVTARTIQNYELGLRKPCNMEVVQKIAAALHTTAEYLLGGEGTLVVEAYEKGGAADARNVERMVSDISAMFAGGTLTEEQKDGVMAALNQAYWDSKKINIKYTPKKYRK